MSFSEELKRAGLSRAELGRRLGVNRQTVSAWGESAPEYARAYVRLLGDLRDLVRAHNLKP